MVVQRLTPDLVRLMKNVRIHLPGALDDTIQLELFNALHEFFTTTKAWKEAIDFDTEAEETEYTISESENAVIFSLIAVQNSADTVVGATMETPGTVVLNVEPTEVETLTATVALTCVDPTDRYSYPYYPDWLLKRYYQTILSGVLSKMMAHPAKPYTNERLAVYHGRMFRAGVAVASAETLHQNNYGGQRWTFPQNFARGRQR